jgi:hypothetical protein
MISSLKEFIFFCDVFMSRIIYIVNETALNLMSRAQRLSLKFNPNVRAYPSIPSTSDHEQGILHTRDTPENHPLLLQRPSTRSMGPCDFNSPRTPYRKTPFLPNICRPGPVQRKALPRHSLHYDDPYSERLSPRKAGGPRVVLRMQRLRPISPYVPGRGKDGPVRGSGSALLSNIGI